MSILNENNYKKKIRYIIPHPKNLTGTISNNFFLELINEIIYS
jgi:hypothetical protein